MTTTLPHRISRLSPFYFILIPLLVWAVLQYILFQRHDLAVPPDAIFRYIPHAQKMVAAGYLDLGHDIRYVGYTLLIAATLKLDLSLIYLVYFQVLLSFWAVILVYKTAYALTSSSFCAFVAALLLASSQDIQQWNYYILTESVFTSAFVFCLAILVLVKKRIYLLLSAPLWVFTCIIRPNGFIIVLAAAAYFFHFYYRLASLSQRRVMLVATMIMGAVLIGIINKLLGSFTLVETYARGEVIYGTFYSDLSPPGSSFFYRITPPESLEMPPATTSALQKLLLFFWHNPTYSIKLALAKGFTFLAFAKPHFSKAHNLLIFLTIYPCYFLAFKAWRQRTNLPILQSLFTVVGLQTIMVMFTVEDWDCRFTAPILPFIFILGAVGIKSIRDKKWSLNAPKQEEL